MKEGCEVLSMTVSILCGGKPFSLWPYAGCRIGFSFWPISNKVFVRKATGKESLGTITWLPPSPPEPRARDRAHPAFLYPPGQEGDGPSGGGGGGLVGGRARTLTEDRPMPPPPTRGWQAFWEDARWNR